MTATGATGIEGAAPVVTITERDPTLYGPDAARHQHEASKYARMWERPEYRAVAPGESIAPLFLAQARPKVGSEVIDFGAGTGRGALMLALMGGCKVHMLDFAGNCLDPEVRQALTTQAHALSFTEHNLVKPVPFSAPYGYCCDVMEHIPPPDVERVLVNVLKAAQHCWFQIACEDDVCGALIGEPLHLSVHDYAWWHQKFVDLGCTIHWSQDAGSHCLFYVTAWQSGQAVVDIGVLNIAEEQVKANVRTNTNAGWTQVEPHPTNDVEVMILGGGPSLNEHVGEIRAMRARGVKLITLNGAYHWALEHGLTPSATLVVDARPFNARFTHPVVDDCKYLVASQCDPAVLDGLPRDRTLLWHTSAEMVRDILDAAYDKRWWPVPGGSTVLLRAIPLLRMLGFRRFHLFGCDSCIDASHHAYPQAENDSDQIITTIVGNRLFHCHAWMIAQAQEFMDLIKVMGELFEVEVYGDGLLAHILRTGAEMQEQEDRERVA